VCRHHPRFNVIALGFEASKTEALFGRTMMENPFQPMNEVIYRAVLSSVARNSSASRTQAIAVDYLCRNYAVAPSF
jgi:hypothetical protein